VAVSFSTKAGTLKNLQGRITSAQIPPSTCITYAEWKKDRKTCLSRIKDALAEPPLIVRSSSHREDGESASNAGAFLSLPNVLLADLDDALDRVFAAYKGAIDADEALIQPMLQHVVRAGVAFSHDPNTCAPYRVINWSEGADTAAVTGGNGVGHTWQQAALSPLPAPPAQAGIMALIEELLAIFDNQPLDCEFAVTIDSKGSEVLWLLQVRPLVLKEAPETNAAQATRLKHIQDKLERGLLPHPFLRGRRTVYGVMPDWNPAEIIGIRPKPLALSLYRELVTDSIWAYQRHNYGYRNLRSFPLMKHFFGLPYIDVRLSFNSFIPADLDDGLASRLVDYYIERLLAEPTLHDKVEFEIVYSCYTLDLPERLQKLDAVGFSRDEQLKIAESLRRLTNRIVDSKNGLWRVDAEKLKSLSERRTHYLSSDIDILERVYWLIEDTKRYGTLPFAGLARAGFVALQLLQSLVSTGILSKNDYDAFLTSLSTVSGQLARDRASLDKSTFLSQYGHLRPGTYDILSPRYDEAPDMYFDWNAPPSPPPKAEPFSITLPQMREIQKALEAHDLKADPVGLFEFLQGGIELREMAKFQFTRNLSDVLALIGEYGSRCGFSREDMAYCDVTTFKELYVAAGDPKEILAASIQLGKARHAETLRIALPPVITHPTDVWAFQWPEASPNFITQKQVTAPVIGCDARDQLAGALVCIPNADPGFDWLFSYPIAGLVTAWGGVNSHMAIRAGEMGLPAVIGAGEMLYRSWSNAKRLHIDCAGRRVEILA
jgi:hypothetical protein